MHRPTRPTATRSGVARPTMAFAALALAAGSLLVGCGDDEPADASSDTSTGSTEAAVAAGEVPEAACDASVDLSAAFGAAPEDPAGFTTFAEETLVPIGEAYTEAFGGDDELGAAATTVSEAFTGIVESGDPSALDSDEVNDARATLGRAVHDGCDLEQADITAVEYAYDGAPDELEAGRVSFALTNEGVEDHEIVLFRRDDDATESLEEILALGDAGQEKMTFTGVAFGGPGTTSYMAADLDPGTYFLICFIPVGGGEDGAPHFTQGMQHTLTVS